MFPIRSPSAYSYADGGPDYDPDLHLALEFPEKIWTLDELGYSPTFIESCASPVAITSPFRILSRSGVATVRNEALAVRESHMHRSKSRTANFAAGGVYRSRLLRDLCACPRIAAHLSNIAQAPLAPHSMPSQQLYINYAPDDLSQAVDTWHFDGIGFDYVLMVSDPNRFEGGDFEFYAGTRERFAALHGLKVPAVRNGVETIRDTQQVVRMRPPAAGFGLFQQGNLVVHRAAPLLEPGERITLVPGYVALDVDLPDPTSVEDMPFYNEPGMATEIARHSAWLANSKLQSLLHELPADAPSDEVHAKLEAAIEDVRRALRAFRRDKPVREE
ncbi:MAG: hypothetical protein CMO26_13070 [Thiotrichales bacterium]|nr:hypothetical protein [Thiotrichales bacterium]